MKKLLLLIIIFAGLVLRTSGVSKNPPSLSWDEVSIGYNAYSILKTGHDEHGKFMPIDAFAAYGDYKPPLAIYSVVPFIAVFGLTDLAVRLPAAVFGTATILLIYLLVYELFALEFLSILTAGIFAVSPWHVNISRGGFEANIALFFIILGAWLVLRARHKPNLYMYAWLPFVAAIYTFNSARYFSPFISFGLIIFSLNSIKKQKKYFFTGICIAFITMIPILPHLLSKESRLRFSEVNIFTDSQVVTTSNQRIAEEGDSLFSRVIHNRRVGYARSFLMHFADNFEPDFLFIRGDGNPKFSIRDTGQLYIIEAPLLAIGFFAMFASYPAIAWLLLYWMLTSIIPAATARETPHALRILNSLPTWHIFIAYGIVFLFSKLKRNIYSKLVILALVICYLGNVSYYIHTYYRHYPKEFSGEWQYGYKEALVYISGIEKSYDSIVISEKIGRPYMYTLFYTKTPPDQYAVLKQSYFDSAGFYHVTGFGRYRFTDVLDTPLKPRTVYVWDSTLIPDGVRVLHTVRLLNSLPVLTIFDTGQ